MPFVESILEHKSISIIGMEKNCGKTVVLNYILSRMADYKKCIAVTSIGIDGEKVDAVTRTSKPEITLHEGMLFATSEIHYTSRFLSSEIIEIGDDNTSLGKVILSRVLSQGNVMLSGPSDTASLKRVINKFEKLGSDIVIVDGALSRKSLASPSVTDGLVLCTGAALSLNIDELVLQTKHTYSMISLPTFNVSQLVKEKLEKVNRGLWAIQDDEILDLEIVSSVGLENNRDKLFAKGKTIFFSGMLTDKALEVIMFDDKVDKCVIVVKDFTRLFISPMLYRKFILRGGAINVLIKSKLIAVCVNPTSPTGYSLNSEKLIAKLFETLDIPVYDVMKIQDF